MSLLYMFRLSDVPPRGVEETNQSRRAQDHFGPITHARAKELNTTLTGFQRENSQNMQRSTRGGRGTSHIAYLSQQLNARLKQTRNNIWFQVVLREFLTYCVMIDYIMMRCRNFLPCKVETKSKSILCHIFNQ